MTTPILLDLSRLLSRVLHPTPTGVDRVEMAYARGLLSAVPERLHFAAVHPGGGYGRLDTGSVVRFLDETEDRWSAGGTQRARRRDAVQALVALRPRRGRALRNAVLVQASPHHLTRPRQVEAILRREAARWLVLVHDLIPLEFPEYARPGGAALHQRRVETITALADGILANSAATLDAIRPWIAASGRQPATGVALLGAWHAPDPRPDPAPSDQPYFLCLGTIEPRKNHLLLLHLWRQMAQTLPAAKVPRLVLIGRRGWENEQVVDLLERCPALRPFVEERTGLPDREVRRLLAGARALLMPSFAEGFGMPVAEALHAGVPVLCSDLPALREAGAAAPEYLDPLDGPGWLSAVLDYADAGGVRWQTQLARIARWRPPEWADHIKTLLTMADTLSR